MEGGKGDGLLHLCGIEHRAWALGTIFLLGYGPIYLLLHFFVQKCKAGSFFRGTIHATQAVIPPTSHT